MTDNHYVECPECGIRLMFEYDKELDKYISMCPFCAGYYEIVTERYFEFDE